MSARYRPIQPAEVTEHGVKLPDTEDYDRLMVEVGRCEPSVLIALYNQGDKTYVSPLPVPLAFRLFLVQVDKRDFSPLGMYAFPQARLRMISDLED